MDRKDFVKSLFLTGLFTSPFASRAVSGTPGAGGSLFDLGAIGDGKHDDSAAFASCLKSNDLLTLPAGKVFKIGNVVLKGKTIRGPGKIRIASGASCAFLLEGENNRIENVQFLSEATGRRPESEIMLGKQMDFAVITGCTFGGKLFAAIGSGLNSEKDSPYKDLPWRKKLVVSHCKFTGGYAHHIYMHRLEDLIVEGSFFEHSSLDSIRLRQWVKSASIRGCHFKDVGVGPSKDSRDAIDTYWSGLQLSITGCQFDGAGTHALDIKGHSPDQDYGSSRIIISGCQIRNAAYSGIFLCSAEKTLKGWKALQYVTIAQNHIEGCGKVAMEANYAAIYMRHNQEMINIEGNQIFLNHNKGILLGNFEPTAPISRNIIIRSNIITNNGHKGEKENYGVHILGGKNVLVSGNIIENDRSRPNAYQTKGLVAENYRNFKLENYVNSDNVISS